MSRKQQQEELHHQQEMRKISEKYETLVDYFQDEMKNLTKQVHSNDATNINKLISGKAAKVFLINTSTKSEYLDSLLTQPQVVKSQKEKVSDLIDARTQRFLDDLTNNPSEIRLQMQQDLTNASYEYYQKQHLKKDLETRKKELQEQLLYLDFNIEVIKHDQKQQKQLSLSPYQYQQNEQLTLKQQSEQPYSSIVQYNSHHSRSMSNEKRYTLDSRKYRSTNTAFLELEREKQKKADLLIKNLQQQVQQVHEKAEDITKQVTKRREQAIMQEKENLETQKKEIKEKKKQEIQKKLQLIQEGKKKREEETLQFKEYYKKWKHKQALSVIREENNMQEMQQEELERQKAKMKELHAFYKPHTKEELKKHQEWYEQAKQQSRLALQNQKAKFDQNASSILNQSQASNPNQNNTINTTINQPPSQHSYWRGRCHETVQNEKHQSEAQKQKPFMIKQKQQQYVKEVLLSDQVKPKLNISLTQQLHDQIVKLNTPKSRLLQLQTAGQPMRDHKALGNQYLKFVKQKVENTKLNISHLSQKSAGDKSTQNNNASQQNMQQQQQQIQYKNYIPETLQPHANKKTNVEDWNEYFESKHLNIQEKYEKVTSVTESLDDQAKWQEKKLRLNNINNKYAELGDVTGKMEMLDDVYLSSIRAKLAILHNL